MRRPNILLFLTDDHGRWAMPGTSDTIVAPALAELGRTGARLERAFTACPVCSPARASLWTGLMPSQHGVHDWLGSPADGYEHPGIEGQATLAGFLKAAGYQTAMCGKWHCGRSQGPHPDFDLWFAPAGHTNARFASQPFYDQDRLVERHGHQAVHLTDRAARFLDERDAGRPFFLTVGLTDTHTPHSGHPARLVSLYRDAAFGEVPEEGFAACHGRIRFSPRPGADERRAQLAMYAAAVSMIDQQVGRLMDVLENLGELENTVIIYTSDHGHMNGHHGLHTKGNATVPQNFIDDSIAVPQLWCWPGRIRAGLVHRRRVDHCDLFASLLEAAGLDWAGTTEAISSPGQSFVGELTEGAVGRCEQRRPEQICEYGNARMIQDGGLKLIRRYPGPNGHFPDELYDLEADPRERRNAIDEPGYRDPIAAMDDKLTAFFQKHEQPGRSGLCLDQQPPCNGVSPWLVDPDEVVMQ